MGQVERLEEERLARRKGKRKEDTNWAEWVHTHTVMFTSEEVEYIMEELKEEQPAVLEVLKDFADQGLKTSFKYNRRKNEYELRVFRDNPEASDAGYAIVINAKNFDRCVAGFLFAMKDVDDFNLAALTEIRERVTSSF